MQFGGFKSSLRGLYNFSMMSYLIAKISAKNHILIRRFSLWPQEKQRNSVLNFYSFPVVKRKRHHTSKKFLANICQKGSTLCKNFRGFFSIDRTISPWCGIVQTLHLCLDLPKKLLEVMGSCGKKSYLTLYARLCYEFWLF